MKPASSHLARRIRLGLLAGLLCLTALSVALISATPITRPRPIPRQPTTIPSCRAAFVARRQVGRSGQALATLFTATLAGFGPINRLCRSPRSFPSLARAGWLLHANSRYLQEHGPVRRPSGAEDHSAGRRLVLHSTADRVIRPEDVGWDLLCLWSDAQNDGRSASHRANMERDRRKIVEKHAAECSETKRSLVRTGPTKADHTGKFAAEELIKPLPT